MSRYATSSSNNEAVTQLLKLVPFDGDTDAFVANQGPDRIWFNDGFGNFLESEQDFPNVWHDDVALGDIDDDGFLDIFLHDTSWVNDGSGTFEKLDHRLYLAYRFVELGDVDGDGLPDALLSNIGGTQVWLNDGSGVFEGTDQTLSVGPGPGPLEIGEIVVGDVDADRDLDVLSTDGRDGIRLWLNDGVGKFSDSGETIGIHADGLRLVDVDGDQDLDVLMRGEVWLQTDDYKFVHVSTLLAHASAVATGDVDGDGDADVLLGTKNGVKVFLNESHTMFAPGDANGDLKFDQFDIVHVLQSGKYLSGTAATFEEGDWNDDGVFDQDDIVAALQTGHYLQGPYSW